MPTLANLPNEILDIIFDGLDCSGLSALRLTSNQMKSATLPAFKQRYFATRYVMVSRISLENLVEIAQHPVLGSATTTLELCIDHFAEWPDSLFNTTRYPGDIMAARREGRSQPINDVDDVGTEEEDQDATGEESDTEERNDTEEESVMSFELPEDEQPGVDEAAYQSAREEQEFLIESGLAQSYITKSLTALPNLVNITIDNSHRPWGALALARQTGLRPTNAIDPLDGIPFLNRILRMTLIAIVVSGIPLQSLRVTAGLLYEGPPSEHLRLPQPYLDHFKRLPPNVETLRLVVSESISRESADEWAGDLLSFIEIFPDITEFEFGLDLRGSHTDCMANLARRLWLPKLQSLTLFRSRCSLQDLAVLFFKHKDILEEITLVRIATPHTLQAWKQVLTLLRTRSSVRRLSILSCRARGGRICCQEQGEDGEIYADEIEFSGTQEEWMDTVRSVVEKND